ncbi:MAG TPA: leucine zipper domain-containing protein [Gammaproteobacteria bacterium]|nr:leucine zipper domain-containing protein [Gammaproteobacteria bacterium]
MNTHKNTRLTIHGGELLVRRILHRGLRPARRRRRWGESAHWPDAQHWVSLDTCGA